MFNQEHTSVIIHYSGVPSVDELPQSTTKNAQTAQFCEANVLISLIDGVETRARCEYRARHIYITSEKQPKHLCDFHDAFMNVVMTQDSLEGSIACYEMGGAA